MRLITWMNKIIRFVILLLLFIPSNLSSADLEGVTYDYPIVRVIDGDTVVIKAAFLPEPLKPELSVRIYGVDTPEKGFRAKCETERLLAQEASEYTAELISNAIRTQVVLYDWDKYGGRVLGDILIDGDSLRQLLVDNGYAREYYGGTKGSWCEDI